MKPTRCLGATILVALYVSCMAPFVAEVTTDGHQTIIMGIITDDPDPVGIWLQYRPVAPYQVLNPSGHARGDGPPRIVWRANAWPVAVWAYKAGIDHDIAFSEWDGSAWTPTSLLTASTDDELDPRVVVEADGTVHVVWWTAGTTERVYLSTRAAGSSVWDTPVLVTGVGEAGRRPAVTVDAEGLRIAYERDSLLPGLAQDIVVATKQPGGGFIFEVVGSTVRTDPLDVMVHQEQDHLWLDWKHEVDEFGCAEWQDSAWSPVRHEPWDDPSWVGIERVRKRIRSQVLGP